MLDRVRNVAILASALVLVFEPITSHAAPPPEARTADFHNEIYSGRPSGPRVNGQPCIHGDIQHYKINDAAELRVEDHQTCGSLGVSGGMMICFLGPQLTCSSKEEENPDIKLTTEQRFSVSESGVTVDGNTYPWMNQQHAVSLFSLIEKKAKERCNDVLFWQSSYKASDKPPPSLGFQIDGVLAEEACKPMLDSLCAASKRGSVKIANGSDISNLCH